MNEPQTFRRLSRSNLHVGSNDAGRVVFCGPHVLSTITGYPISEMERAINIHRDIP